MLDPRLKIVIDTGIWYWILTGCAHYILLHQCNFPLLGWQKNYYLLRRNTKKIELKSINFICKYNCKIKFNLMRPCKQKIKFASYDMHQLWFSWRSFSPQIDSLMRPVQHPPYLHIYLSCKWDKLQRAQYVHKNIPHPSHCPSQNLFVQLPIKNMATSWQKKSGRAVGVRQHSIAANLHTALWSGAGHEPLGEMHLTPASRALMGAAKQI